MLSPASIGRHVSSGAGHKAGPVWRTRLHDMLSNMADLQVFDAVVYRTTYPNGKIYVGQDRTNSINYFGSASSALIAADFSPEQRKSFTVTRDILWQSTTATRSEINSMEVHFILTLRANDPEVGYNRWPAFTPRTAPLD